MAALARAAHDARLARPAVPLALATLVAVEGSSYRQPGARLLVDAEGRVLAGAISGGCLEGDVAARAGEVCATGVSVRLTYDLRADLDVIWGFGSACDGVAHLLLEPLPARLWLDDAASVALDRRGGALVTALTGHAGHTAWLVAERHGTAAWQPLTGDDAPPAPAMRDQVAAARAALPPHGGTRMLPAGHGAPALFVDLLVPPIALWLVGAGRGAEALARIADTLGWAVTVADHRPAVLAALALPATVATRVVHPDADGAEGMPAALAALPQDGRTAVALLTHQFAMDRAWLEAVLPTGVGYVGVLGSRRRAAQLLEAVTEGLAARGVMVTGAMRGRCFAPIGLDLGGEAPASIALAAVAEIEAVMHGRPGAFLRDRVAAIHHPGP
jgi:xanthine/CO dehydrogenase XdhC/CoxF family maturation factor